jgi:hypothetical protein
MRLNPCFYISSSPSQKKAECNAHMTNTWKYRLNVQTWKSPCNWIDYTIRKSDCPSQKLTKLPILTLNRRAIFFCEQFVMSVSLSCFSSKEGHPIPHKRYIEVLYTSRRHYGLAHSIPHTKALYYDKIILLYYRCSIREEFPTLEFLPTNPIWRYV